jgi:hypothetical protein
MNEIFVLKWDYILFETLRRTCYIYSCLCQAPIAQRIEHRSPEPGAQVRFLVGAPCMERCPSGRRSTTGNRVGVDNAPRGFESLSLRHDNHLPP